MYCPQCGNQIPDGSRFCQECGARLDAGGPAPAGTATVHPDGRYKSDAVALILAILLPGLGHLYVGDAKRGLMFLLGYIGIIAITMLSFFVFPFLGIFISLGAFVLLVYNVYDVYMVTKKYNDTLRETGMPPW